MLFLELVEIFPLDGDNFSTFMRVRCDLTDESPLRIDTSACRRNAIHGQNTKHSRVTDVIVQGEDFFPARRSLHRVAKVPPYTIASLFGQGCHQRSHTAESLFITNGVLACRTD